MLPKLKQLFATMSAIEADTLKFEVYDANTGHRFNVVDAYYDDDAFCIDIERAEE